MLRCTPLLLLAFATTALAVPTYQGSWKSPIKLSDTDPSNISSCDSAVGWAHDDAATMVDALLDGSQNLYFSTLGGTDTTSCQWQSLEALAIEAVGTGVELGGEFPDDSSLTEYTDGIVALRQLADDYGTVGMVSIDDFNQRLFLPKDPSSSGLLTAADVGTLWTAAHDSAFDTEIDLVPYMAAKYVPQALVPAYVLGTRDCSSCVNIYDGYLFPNDWPNAGDQADVMELDIAVAPSSLPHTTRILSFLLYDAYTSAPTTKDLDVVVRVNGTDVYRRTMFDHVDQDISLERVPLPPALFSSSSKNSVTIGVEATTAPTNQYGTKLAYVWDVRMLTYHPTTGLSVGGVSSSSVTFNTSRDPGRIGYSTSTSELVASDNSAWRIDGNIDGAMFRYTPYPDYYLDDPGVYRRLVKSTCDHLRSNGLTCLVAHWGNDQWVSGLTPDVAVLGEQLDVAGAYADGNVVWRYELGRYTPADGVYTEREPLDTASYDVMAAFPSWQPGIPGWYQTWTTAAVTDAGTYTLDWADNLSSSGVSGRFFKRLWVTDVFGITTLEWDEDVDDAATSGSHTFSLAAGESVTVGMEEEDSIGSLLFHAQFRLTDPSGDVVALPTFDSGVADHVDDIYDCVHDIYTGAASSCP